VHVHVHVHVHVPVLRSCVSRCMLTLQPNASQECTPYHNSMCLTINKPFYAAFICGQCLNNEHGEADYASCFDIHGKDMLLDAP
jgi:hypothetical protein